MAADENNNYVSQVLHWNYKGFKQFPLEEIKAEYKPKDLYLKENYITRLPVELNRLEYIESLYLSGNDISVLPSEISCLKCLKCLDLSGNLLKVLPEDIGDVARLRYLILDDNELSELPLRLAELKGLRYLSEKSAQVMFSEIHSSFDGFMQVNNENSNTDEKFTTANITFHVFLIRNSFCYLFFTLSNGFLPVNNKLRWLPQKPVYNYYQCELRFWRNRNIECLPYSLWFHMFQDKKIRSLNSSIGCLGITTGQHSNAIQPQRALSQKICLLKTEAAVRKIAIPLPATYRDVQSANCPSLLEICKRNIFNRLLRMRNNDTIECCYRIEYGDFDCITMTNIVEEYYGFLPHQLKNELSRGPAFRCENIGCRSAVFDHVQMEFCTRSIFLFDEEHQVILFAPFCSRKCASVWKENKTNLIQWNYEYRSK